MIQNFKGFQNYGKQMRSGIWTEGRKKEQKGKKYNYWNARKAMRTKNLPIKIFTLFLDGDY